MEEKEITENQIKIDIANTVITPKKYEVMFNGELALNRSLILCALAAYNESGQCLSTPIRCLDAFGATGIAGLQWNHFFPNLKVTVNDSLPAAAERIKKHASMNDSNIEVTNQDINVLLSQKSFDFIFLDCYGSSVQYLDAVFRNVPKNGIIAITSTDEAALYGKAADVTLRNYGGHIIKTFYAKELASRLILASIVRSAAKCNKGIVVLCCTAIKSYITVIVKVIRGPTQATECVHKIRKLLHCCICDDRVFYPKTIYPVEQPHNLLSCNCRDKSTGKVAVELGPVWSAEIFDHVTCGAMLQFANSLKQAPKLISLLQTILGEAVCSRGSNKGGPGTGKENTLDVQVARTSKDDISPTKKLKTDDIKNLPFYFNLHRHNPKGYDLCKLNKIVEYLKACGHRASRTHFDSEAIRTDASLSQFNEALLQFSRANQP